MWIRKANEKIIVILIGILMFASFDISYAAQKTLNVGIGITGGQQRSAYDRVAKIFAGENPDTRIHYTMTLVTDYKEKFPDWLKSKRGLDVLYWQGGERLYSYIREGYILPIDRIWSEEGWDLQFTNAAKKAVTFKESIYAVPTSYYQWGFYYRRSLFDKLSISPPETWQEFLILCQLLKSHGITPITIGTKNHWTAAAWFDYLDLRINGFKFHKNLLAGNTSYTSPQVRKVFEVWKSLVDKQYFTTDANLYNWTEVLPLLYRNKGGMLLMGNFVTNKFSSVIVEDIDFFRFPLMANNIPVSEEAPTDVFVIPKNTQNETLAEKFIAFMGRADIQGMLNKHLGTIPPNINAEISDNHFVQKGVDTLLKAEGITQYFDRDVIKEMSGPSIRIFSSFLQSGDIDKAVTRLEAERIKNYKTTKISKEE